MRTLTSLVKFTSSIPMRVLLCIILLSILLFDCFSLMNCGIFHVYICVTFPINNFNPYEFEYFLICILWSFRVN